MKIRVHNISDREAVSYPLPLLVGDIEGGSQEGRLLVSSSGDPDGVIDWPIVDGSFKVLVRLQPGDNVVNLRHGQESLTLRLIYDLPGFSHIVRPVYIVCADDDGQFQGPEDMDCSAESAVRRIALGAQVIQTLTAEKMKEQGFGRMAFELETDQDFRPVCHVFQSKLTLNEAYNMTGYELWSYFGKELMSSSHFSHKSRSKFYCFMSFTRYSLPKDAPIPKTHSEILKHTRGHTALGGGGLALFGTGNLHTWADSLATFNACLTNRKRMDRKKFMDDSAYREYYWANYATGLGASLHELGHTFDLAHTPTGVMARGFDDLHKVFTVQRKRKGRHAHRTERQPRQRYSSGGSTGSNSDMSRTPSTSSMEETSSSLGSSSDGNGGGSMTVGGASIIGGGGAPPTQRGVSNPVLIQAVAKRQTDVCYGSPFKSSSSSSGSSASSSDKAQTVPPPPPLVVSVESNFKTRASQSSALTFSMKNYDGSETRQTILQGEMVSETTLNRDGRVVAKTTKERRPSSVSINSVGSSSSLSPTSGPSTLPNSPEESPQFPWEQNSQQGNHTPSDSGAHWYRSSAVVLRYHKWFNKVDINDNKKGPTLHGPYIKSLSGMRIVELRTDPEGAVFQHWEFLGHNPPTHFTMQRSQVINMPAESKTVTIMAEDGLGNIMKKRFKVTDFV